MQKIARRALGKDRTRLQKNPRSQQTRQRKGQAFEGTEEDDYAVDLAQAGGSIKSPW